MKKYVGFLLIAFILTFTFAIADQLCTHTQVEIGRSYQYQARDAGHVEITTITTYCSECDEYGYSTTQAFRGHNFVWTGHLHQAKRWHVSYYTCKDCRYETSEGYYCEGPPCSVMMRLPHAHESE